MILTLEILKKEVEKKDGIIADLDLRVRRQQAMIERQQQQLEDLLRRVYGRKSEKLDINQLLMDGLIIDADGQERKSEPEEAVVQEAPATPPKKRKHPGRNVLPEHLPRHEIVISVEEEEKICPVTGQPRPFIGYEESEKLEYIPETLRVNVYKREKYGSPMGAEEAGVVTAALPPAVVDRCLADTGMLAHVAVSKFDDHLPLYRLERILLRQGIHVSRKTMAGWLSGMGSGLSRLPDLMRTMILDSGMVHHDDTPVKMLDPGAGKTKETRFWVAMSGSGPPLIHFSFSKDRKQEHPVEFFRGYSGALMCDEYGGYVNVDCKDLLSCWAHARRYVEKAQTTEPAFATEILLEIAQLYQLEKAMREAPDDERLKIRQTQSRNQLQVIFDKLQSREFRPKSPMYCAAHYIVNHKEQLCRYTNDPRFPIDNNPVERAIRRVSIGRKNWLFLGSETGGKTAATLMSLLATCWINRVNSWSYLADILKRIPSTSDEQLPELLPHEWVKAHPEALLPGIPG